MTTTSEIWNEYIEKEIVVIIEDTPFPKKKEGVLKDIDDSHIFLKELGKEKITPLSRRTIKRVELK